MLMYFIHYFLELLDQSCKLMTTTYILLVHAYAMAEIKDDFQDLHD